MKMHHTVPGLFLGLMFTFGGMTVDATADPAAESVTRHESPQIEVVFALDTTGSMSGLIQGAKDSIWSIVNHLAMAEHSPEIRLGLVGYRDRGDEYITRITDLTDDLDAVYSDLFAFQAQGGGDFPESVNQALHEAVTKISWSEDPKTFRVIFLVGDAPPHMDYENDIQYTVTAKTAIERDIVINAVQCGINDETEKYWRDIARRSEGQYFMIPQTGGVARVATPYDDDLARLGLELDGTVYYYGARSEQAAMRERKSTASRLASSALAAANADRAVFQASEAGMVNFLGRNELVADLADGKVKLEDLDSDELPVELRDLSREEQLARIEEQKARREDLAGQIRELSEKREQFLRDHAAENRNPEESSFDQAVASGIRDQAASKGIRFPDRAD